MPIKIDFLADVAQFLRGTKNVEGSLDDVADSLDDMAVAAKHGGTDAEQAVEDLEDKFKDAERRARDLGDAGEKAGRDIEDGFRDAVRRAKDLGDAGRDAGRDVERGMRDAGDGVKDFKDEADSTAREAAASFDGSAESIADAFQEVAANAFAGFGPAGAVAGLAAAAGIGLATAGFESLNEATEESKERANEWADAFIEAGGRVLDFEQTMAKIRDITTTQYDTATENAKRWGVNIETAIAAMAGSETAIDEVTAALDEQRKIVEDAEAEADKFSDTYQRQTSAQKVLRSEYEAGADALRQLTGEIEQGERQASIYSRVLVDTARATEGATEKTDEFGDTVISLPDGKKVYIDAETGQATADVDDIEKKIYGIRDKRVDVNVSANTWAATNGLNRWISQNNGRTLKIYGKYVAPPGSSNWP